MDTLSRIKLYLNIPLNDDSQDNLLHMLLDESYTDIALYTNRDEDYIIENKVGQSAAVKLAVVKYNRRGTEGMTSQSYSGSSESYNESITNDIKMQLNSLRRAKIR